MTEDRDGPLPKPVWDRRWLIIRLTLFFVALMDIYMVVLGPDDSVREAALWVLNGLAGAVILGYLGFATHDDNNWMRAISGAFGRTRHGNPWAESDPWDHPGPRRGRRDVVGHEPSE